MVTRSEIMGVDALMRIANALEQQNRRNMVKIEETAHHSSVVIDLAQVIAYEYWEAGQYTRRASEPIRLELYLRGLGGEQSHLIVTGPQAEKLYETLIDYHGLRGRDDLHDGMEGR